MHKLHHRVQFAPGKGAELKTIIFIKSKEMQISKEVKVGIFSFFSFFILYSGLLFIKGQNLFSTNNIYHVTYKNSRGTTTSSPIVINGYTVGFVQHIEILPEKKFSTLITFELPKRIHLTDTSIITLTNNSLLGGNTLDITIKPGKKIPSHSTFIGEVGSNFDNIQDITQQVKSLTVNLAKTTEEITTVIGSLIATSTALQKAINVNQENISTISTNLVAVTHALLDKKNGMGAIMAKGNSVLHDIERIKISNLAKKTERILNKMNVLLYHANNKKSNLGALLHDDVLYTNFNHILLNLNNLLLDFKKHPTAYTSFSIFSIGSKKRKEETN